jgi:hypothetical protein
MRIDVVSSIPRPGGDTEIRIGTWVEEPDGSLFRFSGHLPGMTIEEAEGNCLANGMGSREAWRLRRNHSAPQAGRVNAEGLHGFRSLMPEYQKSLRRVGFRQCP